MAITAEQRAVVLSTLENGESLRAAARAARIRSEASIRQLTEKDAEFAAQYAHARDTGLDRVADEVLEIADSATNENAAAARLRFDARRWYLSKLAPKRYGDRIEHSVSVHHTTEATPTAELELIVSRARLQGSDVSDAVIVDNSPITPSIAHTHTDPDVSA